jgi:hypothetical protein
MKEAILRKILLIMTLFVSIKLLALPSFISMCKNSSNTDITFTIKALHKAILGRSDDYKKNCELLAEKMKTVRSLDLREKSIVDLHPLIGLENIEVLFLSKNKITNIWPLAELTNLTALDLKSNNISDISALSQCPYLSLLILDDNKIKNILPVKDLYYLTNLSLEHNPVLDELNDEDAQNLRALNQSLIWFRNNHSTNDYGPLNLDNYREAADQLNFAAARGDLEYFSIIHDHKEAYKVYDNKNLWQLLNIKTRKIMIGIHVSQDLVDGLFKDILNIAEIDENNIEIYNNIYNKKESLNQYMNNTIQYVLMEDAPRAPFTYADKTLIASVLTNYVKSKGKMIKQSISNNGLKNGLGALDEAIRVFELLFSPQFIAKELNSWALSPSSKLFHLRSGY